MKDMKTLLSTPEFKHVLEYFQKVRFHEKDVYANWLAQTYYFVSHSVRLSALGASRLDVDDPLSRRMVAHTREESGHHMIAKKDIEGLGRQLSDFPALGVTNAFYQAQYYKVLFEDPAHLLGQIFMLEALSVEMGPWLYELVLKAHGKGTTKFVEVHAHEDIDHVQKALSALNELSPQKQEGVRVNFFQACEMYFLILRALNEATVIKNNKKAA